MLEDEKMLNKLAKEINDIAKEKGWHDEERTFGEYCALFHAEISEALEEYRSGKELTKLYFSRNKPEGVPIELADVIIRILDYCGQYDIDIDERMTKIIDIVDQFAGIPANIGDFLAEFHNRISKAYNDYVSLREYHLAVVISMIYYFCELYKIDIEKAISLKITYNRTREYRHGGKII